MPRIRHMAHINMPHSRMTHIMAHVHMAHAEVA
jgi:hypothetical protein